MAVDPALLKRFMLDDLYARVEGRMPRRLPGEIEDQLQAGPPPADPRLARAGYLTRLVETERFAPARDPMPWLSARLREGAGDAPAIAAELARSEPAGKPALSDREAHTWQVPGPGGHVRYFLAARWCAGEEDGRRSWLYGFFLRCCEEEKALWQS